MFSQIKSIVFHFESNRSQILIATTKIPLREYGFDYFIIFLLPPRRASNLTLDYQYVIKENLM